MKTKTKSSKVNRAWLHDHVNDTYVKLASLEGYRSRAAYKLREIDQALDLIKPGQLVIDLGSTPGAWSQYARRKMLARSAGAARPGVAEPTGCVIALDLLPMVPLEGVEFLLGDFRDAAVARHLADRMQGRPADVVLSDMAPNLSGIASADAARVQELVELALEFAQAHLRTNGTLVVKLFHGAAYEALVRRFRQIFVLVKTFKPKASRDKSAETFLVGMTLKPAPAPVASVTIGASPAGSP